MHLEGLQETIAVVYGGPARFIGHHALEEGDLVIRAEAGSNLAGLAFGDLDGNGRMNIVIGDPGRRRDGDSATGAVYGLPVQDRTKGIVELSTRYMLYEGGYDATGGAEGLGWGATSGGDVNGDGFDDLIVGAPGYVVGDEYGGASYLLLGGP